MEQNKDQGGAAVRGEAVACKFCDGEGVIHTGIDEAPSRECRRCDGSGIAPASVPAADAPSEPTFVWIAGNKTFSQVFGSEEDARTFMSQFPPSVSGGISITKSVVIGKSRAADALDSQPTERASNDAVKIAVSALKEISESRFGWDGDCGVTAVADAALEAIEAAQASSQPTDGGVRNG